jgi:hypothetical protein
MVRRGEFADINAALRAMAESSGLKVVSVSAIKEGGSFFKNVVSKPAYWLEDNALKLKDHGEFTHLLQDLVVDRALGGAGRSAEFRSKLLARAEGTVTMFERGGQRTRWTLGDDGQPLANTLFADTETQMTVGDHVWRWTYHLFYEDPAVRAQWGRLPQPEVLRPTLNDGLGIGLK